MNNLKILFSPCHYVYDKDKSGSEFSWAFNIADRISSQNKDSVVITGFKTFKERKNYKIIELQKNKNRVDMSIGNAIFFNLQYFLATRKQLNRQKYDIVHHVLPFAIGSTFNMSLLLKGTNNIPFIIGPVQSLLEVRDKDSNSSDLRNFNPSVKKMNFSLASNINAIFAPFFKYLSLQTLKRADKIVTINKYTCDVLMKNGIKKDNIVIIPPGIDILKFQLFPYKEKAIMPIEFISVGYLLQRKGVDLVIRALKQVIKVNKQVRLRIIGDGPQRQALKDLVRELNLSEHVVFEGFIQNSEVQKYYQKAQVFVSMSRYESWGQMYLEAMACGLPIITTRNVGSNEIIKEGEFGYLVEQENVKELAEKMIYLIEHPDVIASFGKKARQEVEKKYDWEKVIIPKYLKVYSEVINTKT